MGKSVRTIRLYKAHDLDLISFVYTHDINFNKTAYCALKAFVKGETFNIEIPPKKVKEIKNKRKYEIKLVFDEEVDADIIDMINKIKENYRNNFIKNLIRMYISNPVSEEYVEDENDYNFFSSRFELFRKGNKLADFSYANSKSHRERLENPKSAEEMPSVIKRTEIPKKQEFTENKPVKEENLSYLDIENNKPVTEPSYINSDNDDVGNDIPEDLSDQDTLMQLFKDMTMEG